MTVEILQNSGEEAAPIHFVAKGALNEAGLEARVLQWARANDFSGEAGQFLLLPHTDGGVAGALYGTGGPDEINLSAGTLGKRLPEGLWRIDGDAPAAEQRLLGIMLGNYAFTRYGKKAGRSLRVVAPAGTNVERVRRIGSAVHLVRDLINTPTNDMGPTALEAATRELASVHGASVTTIAGDDLLANGFPMIHAVGRAASDAPRLIDMIWGEPEAPKVTLVGKGVCFDTGGLDIKPASGMLLMKKDMGGAANVLGLASMIMAAGLKVRLRVLIPAVENAIAGNAFRPGDVLPSRKGISVEIGNTDAEGRLVLGDALALADEEQPEILIDMATLTGAARVALGPELPPFFTNDEGFAGELSEAATVVEDPVWRLPLWKPYEARLASKIADTNNVTSDGFAGSITAALFLQKFVEQSATWVHFDIFGWNPLEKPHCPVGGEAQAIRAIEHVLAKRFAG